MSAPIHVSLASDENFAMQLATTLASVAAAHEPGQCRASVLCSGLTERTRERIAAGVRGRLPITWVEVDTATLTGAHFPDFLSPATLFRLLLPLLLPADLDRTIYLDADMLVVDDLSPIWEVDLGEEWLAAVGDGGAPVAGAPLGPEWRVLGMAPGARYFNAGLMVMPLDVWRARGIALKALDVLRAGRPRWGDQDALNVVAEGRWKPLRRRWNVQYCDIDGTTVDWGAYGDELDEALQKPAVIHYSGMRKPWSPGGAELLWADRWFDYLDRTDWAGWRPAPQPRGAGLRLKRRLGRTWRVLRTGQL